MTSPWVPVAPLPDPEFATLRRRAIFDCDKWDPQVGDACVIAKFPLVITRAAWASVAGMAESLAGETVAAELELLERPDLWRTLRLPRAIRHALARVRSDGPPVAAPRLMRFDFHFTSAGWQVSEVNSDVPGGLNEASGFATLMAPRYPQATPTGDPAGAYATALAGAAGPGATIACLHATAFSDDQQMMRSIARRLESGGHRVHLASPAHLRWRDGRAQLAADWWNGPLDLVVRFFPADWLPGLPAESGWRHFYAGARTPLSNPAIAILSQHKRFPLVWDHLRAPMKTWRTLLPETRDPRDVPRATSDDWVLKPVLGRAGEGVCVSGVTSESERRKAARQIRWWPSAWIAQRRFDTAALDIGGQPVFPCLGIYTLDGRVIGAYGRIGSRPLIDSSAADAAVLAA